MNTTKKVIWGIWDKEDEYFTTALFYDNDKAHEHCDSLNALDDDRYKVKTIGFMEVPENVLNLM